MTHKELRLPRSNPSGCCRCTILSYYRISYFAIFNVLRLIYSKTSFSHFFARLLKFCWHHVPLVREFEFQSDSQYFLLSFFFLIIWSNLALGQSNLFKFKDISPVGWSHVVNFSANLNSWHTQAVVMGNEGNKWPVKSTSYGEGRIIFLCSRRYNLPEGL